jgi:hypothetical protein
MFYLVSSFVEIFLLCAMESLSPTDYLRIITDITFIHPKLQQQLAGDRSQPFTTARLRSIWNDLSIEDFQSISNSFLHHMRIVEKRSFSFTISQFKRFFNGCRFPPRRRTTGSSTQGDPSVAGQRPIHNISLSQAIPSMPTTKAVENHNYYEQHVDVPMSNVRSTGVHHLEAELQTQAPPPPPPPPNDSGTEVINMVTNEMEHQNYQHNVNTAPKSEQDPIMILNDIADHDSVSSSINGYTSMSSSIGSSTIHRHCRRHQRIAATINRTDSSITNSVASSNQNQMITLSPSSSSEQPHQQYRYNDIDNDSTTSSNTGYISMGSSSRISISGSVASV